MSSFEQCFGLFWGCLNKSVTFHRTIAISMKTVIKREYDYGGVVDCAPNEFGTYVPIGNLDEMAKAVMNCRKKTQSDIDSIRAYAVGRFSPETIYKKQVDIYTSLIDK